MKGESARSGAARRGKAGSGAVEVGAPVPWAQQWLALKQAPFAEQIAKAGLSRKVTVDTSQVQACAKDPSHKGPFFRHHKGFDSFTGLWNKGILFHYHEYRDCVRLCEDCHCEIHWIYEPYVEKWFNHTAAGAVTFRKRLIEICGEWLSGKIKSQSVPKAYRRQFHSSLKKWQRAKGKRATG